MKLDWDKTIKVGDIITTYHAGYWKLLEIEKRYYDEDDIFYYKLEGKVGDEYAPVFTYELVYDSKGKKITGKRKKQSCDASYCYHVNKSIDKTIAEKEEEIAKLKMMKKELKELA